MENLNVNQNPVDTMPQTPEETPKSSSVGPFIGIIIVILVIILGGLYFWGQRVEKNADESILTGEDTVTEDNSVEILETQSSSDEIADIEEDLNTTDLENLDRELQSIESDLDAAGL